MGLSVKNFQLTIPASKESLYSALEQLTGWQTNNFSWQQGRFRTLAVDANTDKQMLLLLTTSFVGLVPLAQLHIQLESEALDNLYVAKIRAKFASGVFVFAVFFFVFVIAIAASNYNVLLKLPFYGIICFIYYMVFWGIYRDRENLISDLLKIQNQFTANP